MFSFFEPVFVIPILLGIILIITAVIIENRKANIKFSTTNLKEKLSQSLGAFGLVISFILYVIIRFAPLTVLGFPFIVDLILIVVITSIPILNIITSGVLWFWGLVTVINGPQDVLAIIYYILFSIWAIYTIITLISSFNNK